jgi:hypothetical protein
MHEGALKATQAIAILCAPGRALAVERSPAWWVAAIVIGSAFVAVLGRGINFQH